MAEMDELEKLMNKDQKRRKVLENAGKRTPMPKEPKLPEVPKSKEEYSRGGKKGLLW